MKKVRTKAAKWLAEVGRVPRSLSSLVYTSCIIPRTVNMMNFTFMISLCYVGLKIERLFGWAWPNHISPLKHRVSSTSWKKKKRERFEKQGFNAPSPAWKGRDPRSKGCRSLRSWERPLTDSQWGNWNLDLTAKRKVFCLQPVSSEENPRPQRRIVTLNDTLTSSQWDPGQRIQLHHA